MFIISKHTINIYDLYHYPLSFKSFTLQELESQLGEEWRVTLAQRRCENRFGISFGGKKR